MDGGGLASLKAALLDLLQTYLGRQLGDAAIDTGGPLRSSKTLKSSLTFFRNRDLPPKEEQLAEDVAQLLRDFPDGAQVRHVAEPTMAHLLLRCGAHQAQVDFLLAALHVLADSSAFSWDAFIPVFLKAAASLDPAHRRLPGVSSAAIGALATAGGSGTGDLASSLAGGGQIPAPQAHGMDSVAGDGRLAFVGVPGGILGGGTAAGAGAAAPPSWLKPLVCRVLLIALDAGNLRAMTCLEILSQVLTWMNQSVPAPEVWGQAGESVLPPRSVAAGSEGLGLEKGGRGREWEEDEWEEEEQEGWLGPPLWRQQCVEVLQALVHPSKTLLPFYALLHSLPQIQASFVPDDEATMALFLEIHERRDRLAQYLALADGHLQCPSFATLRLPILTYPGSLGEPLHGQEVADAVPPGSLEWQRALRCLEHGLRCNPPSDWWRKVLLHPPRLQAQTPAVPRHAPTPLSLLVPEFSAAMTCEAMVDRIVELMRPPPNGDQENAAALEAARWQEWLSFGDLFYYIMRTGFLDLQDFIDQLHARFAHEGRPRSNHVTWLLAQVSRVDVVASALVTGSQQRLKDTVRKILWFHAEGRGEPQGEARQPPSPWSVLLEYVGSCLILRMWSLNKRILDEYIQVSDHLKKGQRMDDWWRHTAKGPERGLDYRSLDDNTMGMVWVLSHTMSQPVCEALLTWMRAQGSEEVVLQAGLQQVRLLEGHPLPMNFVSGLSLQVAQRLVVSIEEMVASEKVVVSASILETYARLLLAAPHVMHNQQTIHPPAAAHVNSTRIHLQTFLQGYEPRQSRNGVPLLLLELLNYRLLPFFRYQGKIRGVLLDLAKILITVKKEPGEHRLYRLAENVAINLILSLREVMLIKKELKGASTDLTETLNRLLVVNLAMSIKTRGVPDFEQFVLLQPALDQILAASTHRWSDKTLRHFPALIRDAVAARPDVKSQALEMWRQVEAPLVQQVNQLLLQDPAFCAPFVASLPREHRPFLCAAAWGLLTTHQLTPLSLANLSAVMREITPEEVTKNAYTLVDVLLHTIHSQVESGVHVGNLLLTASHALSTFMWTADLLPFDILLLALVDRDDLHFSLRLVVGLLLDRQELKQHVQQYCAQRQQQEHWMHQGPFPSLDPAQALGSHLAGRDSYPIFFDHVCLRAIPLIQLVVHRLIEHDALETADRMLAVYSTEPYKLLSYHPLPFSFVRDTLAYFYPNLTPKLVVRLLSTLDLSKIPFSVAFLDLMGKSGTLPGLAYYRACLAALASTVLPPLHVPARAPTSVHEGGLPPGHWTWGPGRAPGGQGSPSSPKPFFEHMDTGPYVHLLLEAAAVELLSLPLPLTNGTPDTVPSQVVRMLMAAATQLPHPNHGDSSSENGGPASAGDGGAGSTEQPPVHPSSPSGRAASSCSAAHPPLPLMIQAAGLLLAQLPTPFQTALYAEAAKVFSSCPWLTDPSRSEEEGEALLELAMADPCWAAATDTSSEIGSVLALVHATMAALPYEWLEGAHQVVALQRPLRSVPQLRLSFRLLGPLLPRTAISQRLFLQTLALLFAALADVFGETSSEAITGPAERITDLADFMHNAVMLEGGHGGQPGRRPKAETLHFCTKAIERLRLDVRTLFRHLSTDPNVSMYAATHPKLGRQQTVPAPTVSFSVSGSR